jgi:hypothetical protein
MRFRFLSTLFTTGLVATIAATGFAQSNAYPPAYPTPYPTNPQAQQGGTQPGTQGDPNDPEDSQHGVARVSIAQGDVNVKRGDNGQLDAVVVNAPLMTHDHLETSPGSRAEIALDAVNFVRLAPNTDLGLADVQYHHFQAQLGIGTIVLRVVGNSISQVEIDTPSVALRPLGPGEYRISVFDNGTSQVTVRSGGLEMSGPSGSQSVNAGQSLLVRGDFSNPEYQNGYEIARDQFDQWSETRDNELTASQSYNYVSSDITGAQDLDANGTWVPSQYGQVWEPQSVPADWSPYSDGQWAYTGYYGWTWIDNAPWGWAPYHYGRWFMNGARWCWWPGSRSSFYLWSPALVGFFGFGRGGLGWTPLAPFEVGFSWWGRGLRGGFGYGYGFNRGIGSYRNAAFRGGAIAASFGAFGGPGQHFRAATRAQLAGATAFHGRLPISPGQGAYRFSNRAAVVNPRLSAGGNRQFFSRQMTGGSGFRNGNGANSFHSAAGGFRNAPSANRSSGWQRFGSPGNLNSVRPNSAGANSERSGWHKFGQPQLGSRGSRGNTPSGQRQGYGGQSAPRYNAPSGQSHYGGGSQTQHYSAPAQPRYSAPHYSAPQSHSGGGGGGGHRGR